MSTVPARKAVRFSGAEAAAAWLSDQMGDNWRRTEDGRWWDMPDSAGPAKWGIKPEPLYVSGDDLIGLARHFGWNQ